MKCGRRIWKRILTLFYWRILNRLWLSKTSNSNICHSYTHAFAYPFFTHHKWFSNLKNNPVIMAGPTWTKNTTAPPLLKPPPLKGKNTSNDPATTANSRLFSKTFFVQKVSWPQNRHWRIVKILNGLQLIFKNSRDCLQTKETSNFYRSHI